MGLLELVILVLVLCWVGGFLIVPIGGSLIHLLLLIVLVLIVVRLLRGERI